MNHNNQHINNKLDINGFSQRLRNSLKVDLPGEQAHRMMAPSGRSLAMKKGSKIPPRESAVLIAIYPANENISICFIKRPEYDGVHSGQIAFPGGGREKEDANIIETALREAYEEVHILQHQVEVLGQLSPIYIPPSNYVVSPVVGMLPQRPDFIAQPDEVAEIIEIQLEKLIAEDVFENRLFYPDTSYEIEAPCFNIDNTIIWGATAMILYEFIAVSKEVL